MFVVAIRNEANAHQVGASEAADIGLSVRAGRMSAMTTHSHLFKWFMASVFGLALGQPSTAGDGAAAASADAVETVEMASFKVRTGVSHEAVLAARQQLQSYLSAAPGYLSSRLVRDADGTYTDLVVWRDAASAHAAAKAALQDADAGAYFALIDEATIVMRHAGVVADFSR